LKGRNKSVVCATVNVVGGIAVVAAFFTLVLLNALLQEMDKLACRLFVFCWIDLTVGDTELPYESGYISTASDHPNASATSAIPSFDG
jgi:hypothetical protein